MKKMFILLMTITICQVMYAQSVGIGTTTPNASSLLDISSTTKGVLIPRMTTSQRNAIFSPATGLQILNLDDYCLDVYDGTSWIKNCGYKVTGTDTAASGRTIANFGGVARYGAVAFSIGTKGYVGTGSTAVNGYKKDFWEYEPATNTWTQKADFGGTPRYNAVGFVLNNKGYIATGFSGNPEYDLWFYDPTGNNWVNTSTLPGFTGRMNAVAFTISGVAYIGLGFNPVTDVWYQDMYRYDPNTNAWLTQTNYPVKCHSMIALSSPTGVGYVGIGIIKAFPFNYWDNTFYKFTPTGGGIWTAMTTFPGGARQDGTGFTIGFNGYVTSGEGSNYFNDVWKYDYIGNTWTQMQDLGATARSRAVSFVVNGEAFIGTGYDGAAKQDFAGYIPYRIGPVYDNTLDLSVAGGMSDGIWKKDINTVSTDDIGTPKMIITSGGNVGIGTAVSHAPLQLSNSLQSRKIVLYESANNDQQFFGMGVNSGIMRYQVGATSNDHVFYAGIDPNSSSELMRIKGNGSVGIGTNNPDNKFSVLNKFGVDANGSIRCKNNPRMLYFMEDGVANKMLLCHSPAFPTWGLQYLGTSNTFRFLADSLPIMSVYLGSNSVEMNKLGIGTPTPAYKLEVKTTTNDYGISHTDGTVHLASWIGDGGEIGTVSNHTFRLFANNGVNQFELLPNGNIGMGLSGPNNKLDIAGGAARTGTHATGRPLYVTGSLGDASNGVEIRDADGAQGVGIGRNTLYAAGSSADQNIGLAAKGVNGNILFIANGAERIRFSPTGQIGLGTTTPHAPIMIGGTTANRKIVLWETADNNHQFYGFGVNGNILRYQTDNTLSDHVFYAATSTTSSNELMRIKGNGNVTVSGVIEMEAFIAPTLLNGFTNYLNGYSTAAYYKDKMGIVHLRGMVQLATNQSGLAIFTLPAGYRPVASGQLVFPSQASSGLARIDVLTSGNVTVMGGSTGWISLDGITFRAD
ncbi:MAG: hypothetical protein ABJB16_12745 [Saprospiraceae bacterium]